MGSKKTPRAYVLENLEHFAQDLVRFRDFGIVKKYSAINLEGLQKAIMLIPRKERENVEHFWGLTGGINHSKKLFKMTNKDVALIRQSQDAITSLRSLFRLDYMYIYDDDLKAKVMHIAQKINTEREQISELCAVKYLMAFMVILQGGPKMSFENDPMKINTEYKGEFTYDEYSIINTMYEELQDIPKKSISFKLIFDFLDMLDWRDALAIKKSFGIEVPKEYQNVEVEPLYTLEQIRNFKERVFKYGEWAVTSEIILGNPVVSANLEEFLSNLDTIRKNWAKIAEFKVGESLLRTPHELRTIDVYNIGGFDFTDIYEVMFLYLERNLIEPKIIA